MQKYRWISLVCCVLAVSASLTSCAPISERRIRTTTVLRRWTDEARVTAGTFEVRAEPREGGLALTASENFRCEKRGWEKVLPTEVVTREFPDKMNEALHPATKILLGGVFSGLGAGLASRAKDDGSGIFLLAIGTPVLLLGIGDLLLAVDTVEEGTPKKILVRKREYACEGKPLAATTLLVYTGDKVAGPPTSIVTDSSGRATLAPDKVPDTAVALTGNGDVSFLVETKNYGMATLTLKNSDVEYLRSARVRTLAAEARRLTEADETDAASGLASLVEGLGATAEAAAIRAAIAQTPTAKRREAERLAADVAAAQVKAEKAAEHLSAALRLLKAAKIEEADLEAAEVEKLGGDVGAYRTAAGGLALRLALQALRQGKLDAAQRQTARAEGMGADVADVKTRLARAEWTKLGARMDLAGLEAFVALYGDDAPDAAQKALQRATARRDAAADPLALFGDPGAQHHSPVRIGDTLEQLEAGRRAGDLKCEREDNSEMGLPLSLVFSCTTRVSWGPFETSGVQVRFGAAGRVRELHFFGDGVLAPEECRRWLAALPARVQVAWSKKSSWDRGTLQLEVPGDMVFRAVCSDESNRVPGPSVVDAWAGLETDRKGLLGGLLGLGYALDDRVAGSVIVSSSFLRGGIKPEGGMSEIIEGERLATLRLFSRATAPAKIRGLTPRSRRALEEERDRLDDAEWFSRVYRRELREALVRNR